MYRNMMTTMMEFFTKRTTSVKHAKLLSQPVPNIALFVTFVYPSSIITAYGNVLFSFRIRQCVGQKNYKYFVSFLFLHSVWAGYLAFLACITLYTILE